MTTAIIIVYHYGAGLLARCHTSMPSLFCLQSLYCRAPPYTREVVPLGTVRVTRGFGVVDVSHSRYKLLV